MPILTSYVCDKCRASQDDREGMFCVDLNVRTMANRPHVPGMPKQTAIWCRPCVVGAGLVPPSPALDEKAPPAPATLDEIVREIVHEELENA